jgi:hypothetical protein
VIFSYQSAKWTASLTVYSNFITGTSGQNYGNILVEHFQRKFFFLWCVHLYLPGQTDERKVTSIILSSFLRMNNIKNLVWSVYTSLVGSDLSKPLLYLFQSNTSRLSVVPQQLHLRGYRLGRKHHRCPSTC